MQSDLHREVISVEISPNCPLRCPQCIVQKRLRDTNIRYDKYLYKKIIDYAPKNCLLLFVGLGEPAIPEIQGHIFEILKNRPDINGYIQTNGFYKLSDAAIDLIKKNRLTIGLSLDSHHVKGGQKLKIQTELVSSLSITIKEYERYDYEFIKKSFPNINRIMISPLLLDNQKVVVSWNDIKKTCADFTKNLPNIAIYTELPFFVATHNPRYLAESKTELIQFNNEWWTHTEGNFFMDIETKSFRCRRILIDGTVTEILEDDAKSWSEIYSRKEFLPTPIEDFYPRYIVDVIEI